MPNDDHTVEVTVYSCLQLQRCERGGRRVWRGLMVVLEVSNGEEQREGILIISAAAPAISTYETDRAKHQLMQQYPDGDPARTHLSSEQQPSDYRNDCGQPRDPDGRFSLFSYPECSAKDLISCGKSASI